MKISTAYSASDIIRTLTKAEQALASSIYKNNLNYKTGDSILIVTDANMLKREAAVWFEGAKQLDPPPTQLQLFVLAGMTHSGQEPPTEVVSNCEKASIVILHTTHSLTHTQAGKAAVLNGGRGASLPQVDYEMMTRTLTADYRHICQLGEKLKTKLESGKTIQITSAAGTDITAQIRTSHVENDCGILNPGELGNLPAGEVFFAPVLDTTNGTWVVNGSLADEENLPEPVIIIVRKGLASKISGGKAASRLSQKLTEIGSTAFTVAELGIGTNQAVNPTGKTIESEKAYGTAHLALGNSSAIGGEVNVPIHIDGVSLEVEVKVDDNVIW